MSKAESISVNKEPITKGEARVKPTDQATKVNKVNKAKKTVANKRYSSYIAIIPYKVVGIPCQIAVSYYRKVPSWKGSISSCPSSDDYYGYTESSYDILDIKGYRARWLEAKLKPSMTKEIEAKIDEYYSTQDGSYDEP